MKDTLKIHGEGIEKNGEDKAGKAGNEKIGKGTGFSIHALGYGCCAVVILSLIVSSGINSSKIKKAEAEMDNKAAAYELVIAEKDAIIAEKDLEIEALQKSVAQAEKVNNLYEQLLDELKK